MSVDYGKLLIYQNRFHERRASSKRTRYAERVEEKDLIENVWKETEIRKSLFCMMDLLMQMCIHLGTALNKVLKDIIIRYYDMKGYFTPIFPDGIPTDFQPRQELLKNWD